MAAATVELFTLAYSDSTLSAVPTARGVTPVDLRALTLDAAFDDRFAESRFLLSPEARATAAEFVGLCSANYDRKWPDPPHLVDLPRLARGLERSQALGEELLHLDMWMASAEQNHPGMVAVLERLARTFGLVPGTHRVPGANTFICHRSRYLELLDLFSKLLTAALDWYGTDVPFQYRCPDCGSVSDSGYGRWTKDRHMGYLGERITRLIFASMPEIAFWTPAEFEASSRVRALSGRVQRKARALTGDRGADGAAQEPWHRSAHALPDGAAGFTVCPVCADMARGSAR